MKQKGSSLKTDFYDGSFGSKLVGLNMHERPTKIVIFYLNRQTSQNNISIGQARKNFSEATEIGVHEILNIECGMPPTSIQIKKMVKGMGWSIFFIFGISKGAYQLAESMFFNDLEIANPTAEEKRDFKVLYRDLLTMVTEQNLGG